MLKKRISIPDLVFILACILVVGFVARREFAPSATASRPSAFAIGESVNDRVRFNYADYDQTLLLIVNSECKFCTASMPVYKQLRSALERCPRTGFTFVSREPESKVAEYLAANDNAAAPIESVELAALTGASYPTVLAVDKAGNVLNKWQGLANDSQYEAIIASLPTCSKS